MTTTGGGARRLKALTLLAGVAIAGLSMLAWTGSWFAVRLASAQSAPPAGSEVAVTGGTAAPALIALSLAGLAIVAALALAGRAFRAVLAVLHALIGACVLLSAILALADPLKASAPALTKATGIAGTASLRTLVSSVESSPWPWVAIASGVLAVALGILILVTGRRWPASSRRYTRFAAEDGRHSAVDDWDELSEGIDPTETRPPGGEG